jgi:molybdopterin synthase catalytic subunit/molybdopterin converting factor small subunit
MRLRVLLFASLRERAGASALELDDLPEGLDVAGLKRELERRLPELGSLASARGVLGTQYVDDRAPLPPSGEVALLPPVSGGAPDFECGVFELSPSRLDPSACHARVAHPSCGAVVLFTGMTRDHSRERDVVRLEYEAFEAMAGPEMQRIFQACIAAHGDPSGEHPERRLRMLCVHRTGAVAVGEPSVAVAVASPHRAAAFEAARFLIDALKSSLPVWKKELYRDGEHWVGDRS